MKASASFAVAATALVLGFFAGKASVSDPNAKPVAGESGPPANCRAYVQTAVTGYRSHEFDADAAMAGLERNCGVMGGLWDWRP